MERGIDYPGITCVFFCHDGEGNFLMHKRSQNCRDEKGCWDVGGGAVEFGASLEETVEREVKEEYGTKPLDTIWVPTAETILRTQNGVDSHWLALLYVVLVDRDEVRIGEPEKMDELGWFRRDDLPNPRHSQFDRFLEVIDRANQKIIRDALEGKF